MTSTTRIENDELIEDKILSLNRGFIKDFKKLAEMKVDGEIKVTVAVLVTEDQVIETLKASGVEVKISGGLMFAQFMDMKQQMEDEANIVKSLFNDPPENSPYDLEISYSNPVEKGDKYNIALEVTIKVNKNYDVLRQNLKNILDEISFDYSDIQFPNFKTKIEKRDLMSRVPHRGLKWSAMYLGSTTSSFVIFNNLEKESLYNKHLSESEYKNLLSRYEFWENYDGWFFERDGDYLFADLFDKGSSPYIVGIMLSDTELRIYRLLNEESFSIIRNYLNTYLYMIDFSISQTLSEKLEGMENHEIVHTFSFNLQPVHVNLYRAQYPKSSLSLKTRGIGEYSLPNARKIKTPREFLSIPPATDWRLVLVLDRENEYLNRRIYGPANRYWGKITFLPKIETNQTFATIEEINLEITSDVLSKLKGIKIGVGK